jgi:thioredoxin-like negative regulator of GroEL
VEAAAKIKSCPGEPAPRFAVLRSGDIGYHPVMSPRQQAEQGDERPVLLFFSNRRSGPARRMSSLVAWVRVTEKKRLRVVVVDADANEPLVRALHVSTIPALVLMIDRKIVGRLEGRATGREIDRLIRPHVA